MGAVEVSGITYLNGNLAAKAHGVSSDIVRKRLKRGWTVEDAYTLPSRRNSRVSVKGHSLCTKCNTHKPDDKFSKSKSGTLRSCCKDCDRQRKLKNRYGVSQTAFEATHVKQGGGCAICGNSSYGKKKRSLCVDHCHTTGQVRGLLCNNCNVGLGKFRDNPSLLRLAVGYLERSA